MKNLNFLQKSGMLSTFKQQKGNTSKAILLNLKQKLLNQVCNYSDAFILVTGNITVTANNDTDVAFKYCAPFSTCKTVINDAFVDEVNHIYIAMPTYSLIEYSDNYSHTSESLWQFKGYEVPANNADLSIDNSKSFKYKAALAGKIANHNNENSFVKDTRYCSIKVFKQFLEIIGNAINNLQILS